MGERMNRYLVQIYNEEKPIELRELSRFTIVAKNLDELDRILTERGFFLDEIQILAWEKV